MRLYLKNNWQKGQTLIEALVAFMVATMVIVALVAAVTVSLSRSQFVKERTQAEKYAQEGLEWVRAERDINWTRISTRATAAPGSTYCLNNLTWPAMPSNCVGTYITGTNFTREAVLTNLAANRVQLRIIVSWQEGGRTHTSDQTTILTNWK